MEGHNQSYWIPLSDLMTGLMMVFMLIAVTFMLRVEQTTTLVVKEFEETKSDLAQALQKEFAKDLRQWDAELLGDMTIRFDNPDVLFDTGSSVVKPAFKRILNDFIPRYISLVSSEKYRNSIKEIRIEGHTSKKWALDTDVKTAYIKNMRLSQERAQSMLEYILSLPSLLEHEKWMRKFLTSSGFSSSKPVFNQLHIADDNRSQRVEFVIVTNADSKLDEISEQIRSMKNG
ncbi:flagellar motor protein MotB [Legionella birminghamensis]|uniref:Flagellar motor protein MotB n=2 Tax=Legionella birminghamensis TaxID=28083 RepID=A0A378I7F5_9GAMM|nr:flagellar motor protein MotB [Legionella birminghamensis]STX30675.1 flagellar motor protein MotB [Legionella birminghamensis]